MTSSRAAMDEAERTSRRVEHDQRIRGARVLVRSLAAAQQEVLSNGVRAFDDVVEM